MRRASPITREHFDVDPTAHYDKICHRNHQLHGYTAERQSKGHAFLKRLDCRRTHEEQVQKERDEVLGCGSRRDSRVAPYLKAMLSQNHICVIGNGEKG